MLMRFKWVAVVLLLVSYVSAFAQGIADIIRNSPVPETLTAEGLTADFKAVSLKTSGGDSYMTTMMRMYTPMMSGNSSGSGTENFGMFEMMDVAWTNGKTLTTDAGEFLVTYRLAYNGELPTESNAKPPVSLRLALIRKDSIVEIAPRPDLTRDKLLALLAPIARRQEAAGSERTAALSNMKQLALGAMMYMSDNDDIAPYVQDSKSAFAVIQPYLKNIAICRSLNPLGSRILFNMAIAGVSQTAVESPAETVLFYDEKAWPDGKYLVSFTDGHAKFVAEDEWDKYRKTLRLKLKKSGKPLPPAYWKKIAPNLADGGIS